MVSPKILHITHYKSLYALVVEDQQRYYFILIKSHVYSDDYLIEVGKN
jgi:hypothetical protein